MLRGAGTRRESLDCKGRSTMFRLLGAAVVRFWPVWIGVWLAAMALGWKFAPEWNSVTKSGEVASLPDEVPSRQADRLFKDAFELEYSATNVVIVLSRTQGELTEADRTFISKDLSDRLQKLVAEDPASPITSIHKLDEKGVRALLVSPDRHATLVVVQLTTGLQDVLNRDVVAGVERVLTQLQAEHKVPTGLQVAVTGSATAGRDLDVAEAQTAQRIEAWTIAIVIILLLLLYRAPLAALIPLLTVFVAVFVGLRLLSYLAGIGTISMFRDVRVFITVLAYGAGVDYCVFLLARYREEVAGGIPPHQALADSIERVGGAITASAGTVIGGVGMLAFAQFAKIRQAGLSIPVALILALAGTLTFAGPLLRLFGCWAFWPVAAEEGCTKSTSMGRMGGILQWLNLPDLWHHVGPFLVRRAGAVWLATVAILTPFAVIAVLHYDDQNFNPLNDLPGEAPSVRGTAVLADHFPPGALGSIVVLVKDEKIDFGSRSGIDAVAKLTGALKRRKEELGLADIRSIAEPIGIGTSAQKELERLQGKSTAQETLELVRDEAKPVYVSRSDKPELSGHVTRLELTLTVDPLSRAAVEGFDALRQAVRDALPQELRGAGLAFAGSTASLWDLGTIKREDQHRVEILVTVVVFLLLLVVFRRLILSLYLIVSVLFSYLATLGFTYLVFRLIVGPDFAGLDWKVPIFLFTILVAVGEDYNIFLLARVREEQLRHGPLEAIPVALARTGQVISSCGFIMAGTFASLLSGSLRAMQELGVALAVGVLLDTLVVRPVLVPAFLVLLQRAFPGPLGAFMAMAPWQKREEPSPVQSPS